jgi:GNAT superfamily N-acetyltransferase
VSEPAVALRPATPRDRDFLARVYASTREEELARVPFTPAQREAFLAQQFAAQTAHYERHYADADFAVVLVDGRPAGRLIVARWEGEIRVVDVSLLPAFRGRGVGTRLLRPLLEEADARGDAVSIHVERVSPARRLYRRLGFAAAEEVGVYVRMERPPRAQAKTAS